MRANRSLTAALVATALVLGSAGLALADSNKDEARGKGEDRRGRGSGDDPPRDPHGPPGKPRFDRHGDDKWLLRNDHVSVWFHASKDGKAKPQLRVFHTSAHGNTSGYAVSIQRLVEFAPSEGNESEAGLGRVVHAMNLARKDDWNVQTSETNDTLVVRMVRAEAQGVVTLVFHVSKASPAVKFDLHVNHWRWAENAPDHRLALVMVVHDRHVRASGEANATLDGGYVSWARTASVAYPAGVTRLANVTSVVNEEGKDGRIALVFEAPGGFDALEYDPEFGVLTTASSHARAVPAAPLLAAVTVAAAAGLALGRRR